MQRGPWSFSAAGLTAVLLLAVAPLPAFAGVRVQNDISYGAPALPSRRLLRTSSSSTGRSSSARPAVVGAGAGLLAGAAIGASIGHHPYYRNGQYYSDCNNDPYGCNNNACGTGCKIGAAIAGVVLLTCLAACIFACCRIRRNRLQVAQTQGPVAGYPANQGAYGTAAYGKPNGKPDPAYAADPNAYNAGMYPPYGAAPQPAPYATQPPYATGGAGIAMQNLKEDGTPAAPPQPYVEPGVNSYVEPGAAPPQQFAR